MRVGIYLFSILLFSFLANAETKSKKLQTVTSSDGTKIAYEKYGKGPALIVVNGALSDRSASTELGKLLGTKFTVYSYDRRGRGDSTDTFPYSVNREIEDISAIIDKAGGQVFIFGKSSGASLALLATSALGEKVKKLAIYEPPYSDAEGADKQWKDFTAQINDLLRSNRNAEAITHFMKFVGAPDDVITKMKSSPAWSNMLKMAPTLAYDNTVVGIDRSVPVDIAAHIKTATLVMDGSESLQPMPFMRATADKLGKTIPNAQRRIVQGQAHDISAKALAPILMKFFK